MSMIENFEKLQNTSCAESIFDDINIESKNNYKHRTEIRRKESDFEAREDEQPQKGQTNVSTLKDSHNLSKNNTSRAEILVNMR
jgi:hypothetical protein